MAISEVWYSPKVLLLSLLNSNNFWYKSLNSSPDHPGTLPFLRRQPKSLANFVNSFEVSTFPSLLHIIFNTAPKNVYTSAIDS